jgi:hypothetical protein
MSKTYTKTFGSFTRGVTVEALADVVMEHPFDSSRGGGYGRKTPAADPQVLAREIGEDLLADGWTLQDGGAA